MFWKRLSFLHLIVALLAVTVACGGNVEVGEIPAPPTSALATAAAEVAATISPVPPTATAVVAATLPPPPVVTPEVTAAPPTPEVTPLPDTVVLAADAAAFAGRNPLTGEEVANADDLDRRPIAVKLSNAPADYTRPQAGLNDADLIFEHWTEGSVTRFTAIFYDTCLLYTSPSPRDS